MKRLEFKIKYDEEFQDYYFTPFKDREYYVWISDIFESNVGLIAITDDHGEISVEKIDWKNNKVIILV